VLLVDKRVLASIRSHNNELLEARVLLEFAMPSPARYTRRAYVWHKRVPVEQLI
jgi:hypothetical protein